MMRSANPALVQGTFSKARDIAHTGNTMTIRGTIFKSFLLLGCVLLTSGYTWGLFLKSGSPEVLSPWIFTGLIGGLISAVVTIFKKEWAYLSAPIYALFEGLFIGSLSSLMEAQYPGIVIQAAGLTFGVLGVMLFAYVSGVVRATEKFKLGVVAATGAIFLVYFASLIFSFFGIQFGFIYGSGFAGITFSAIVVIIAALNLVIDFDVIERGANAGAPKHMEWYGAFALMVTLIWLYIEILRLLSKARSSR